MLRDLHLPGVGLIFVSLVFVIALRLPLGPVQATGTLSGTKPNIVFILTDDETFESVAKMPYLSSRTDWVTFDHAYENVSLCCPSRSSILAGQYDTHTGVLVNGGGQNLNEAQTLPVWLNEAGYNTALFGKYLNLYPWNRGNYIPPGWDEWAAFKGPVGYYDYELNQNGTIVSFGSNPADYSTDVLVSKAVNFIQTAEPPFFLYFASKTPHSPFTPAPRHTGVYTNEPIDNNPSFNEANVSDKPAYIRKLPILNASNQNNDRRGQWEMMLAVDEGIQKIDNELAARGLLGNTIEIFMTDNGYAHGEHRWLKKNCPYDVCLKTPLLVRYPGQAARHITQLVENIDIAPTIVELAGATPGIGMDGVSLVPLLEGTASSWRTEILNHKGGGGRVQIGNPPNFWSVRTDTYRYTELATGEKELYDYSVDPYELTNKAGQAAYASIQKKLKARLSTLKAQAQAPLPGPVIISASAPDNTDTTSLQDTDE